MEKTENTNQVPVLRPRNTAFNNAMAGGGENNLEGMAREIFLKFLRETPLYILKGLCELIDPHVAISKIIRDITADVFTQVGKQMTPVIQQIDIFEANGTRGEDILNLAFCGYNLGNNFASAAADSGMDMQDSGPDAPLFGPKITMDGVDFTGSIAGLFMMPPFIFGIIWLLLRFLLENITDQVGGDADTCVDNPAALAMPADESCPPEES